MFNDVKKVLISVGVASAAFLFTALPAFASEAELTLPNLRTVTFWGVSGYSLLLGGILVCFLGMLFGLLAMELAITLSRSTSVVLATVFFAISLVFVWRSFYAMRIKS